MAWRTTRRAERTEGTFERDTEHAIDARAGATCRRPRLY